MLVVLVGLTFWSEIEAQTASSIRNLASLGPGGGGGVFAAVFHNTNPDIILLGQDVGGIEKSADGGLTWRHVNSRGFTLPDTTLDTYNVDELRAHPTNNDRFFACSLNGLYRSDDVGETWERLIPPVGTPGLPVSWIAFSPLDPNLGLVGTGGWHEPGEGSGMYRTQDGGDSFSKIEDNGIPEEAAITSIILDPDNGAVYASTTAGLFLSTDNGDSFTKVSFAFRHDQGQWIGVGRSGASKTFWYILYTLGEDEDLPSRSAGIYRSSDAATWTEITGHPLVNDDESNELMRPVGGRVHPSDSSVLLMNLRTDGGEGGLFRYDGTWTNITDTIVDNTWSAGSGFFGIAPECIEINASDPSLIISCNEKAVYKSTDAGASWTQVSMRQVGADRWTGTGAEVVATYAVAASNEILYAGFEDIRFWRSEDRGATWKQLLWPGATPGSIRPDGATEIYLHPSDPDRFYVALGSFSNNLREINVRSEIQKSLDGGTTTMDMTPPSPADRLGRGALAVVWGDNPSQDTLYAAFHGDTLYKSADGGSTWNEISTGLPEEDRQVIYRITVDPNDSNTVYLGLNTFFGDFNSQGGLYRSTDGGASWSRLDYPFQDVLTIRFAGDPARLFVGGWTEGNGSFRVSDDGTSFSEVLDQPFVTDVVDLPGSAGTLVAVASATFTRGEGQNAGLYRSSDNGASWTHLEGDLQLSRIFDIATFADQPNLLYLASDGDGILAVEIDDLDRHFAHFGDGGGITSTLILVNSSSTRRATGTVEVRDGQGSRLALDVNGMTRQDGEFSFDLPARGVGFFASGGMASSAATGSVRVDAEQAVGGTILFSGTGLGVAGVAAVQPTATRFLVPIESNSDSGISTGIALSNPSGNSVDVTVRLRLSDGTLVEDATSIITLAAQNQIAQFPDQIFPGIDLSQFQGSFEVESPVPITGLAIRLSPGQFATLPVTIAGFGARRLSFAQFGDGQGTSSTLIVINPSATQTATGTAKLFDSQGNPLTVDINGMVETGEFSFSIPPQGVGFFATDGEGDPLVTGSVEVQSDNFIGGTLLFSGSAGVAGVGAAQRASRFLVPIESDSLAGINTGVALANPGLGTVEVTLTLRDEQGQAVANGTTTLTLGPRGQVAQFPEQLFSESGIDFTQFRGTLEIGSIVPLAGLAVRLSSGEFATLPVTAVN